MDSWCSTSSSLLLTHIESIITFWWYFQKSEKLLIDIWTTQLLACHMVWIVWKFPQNFPCNMLFCSAWFWFKPRLFHSLHAQVMQMSWHANAFHITGPLWGASTTGGPPNKGAKMCCFVFFVVSLDKLLNKQLICQEVMYLPLGMYTDCETV